MATKSAAGKGQNFGTSGARDKASACGKGKDYGAGGAKMNRKGGKYPPMPSTEPAPMKK